MPKLSVAIATYNEEKNIQRCLESVSFADEIVIVDESSVDKTRELAKKYTKNIIKIPRGENFHKTKQLAIENCEGDWIFVIDADEEITPELKTEILETISKDSPHPGYEIPRKNKIFGKWFSHTGFYPDYQVRLFKNGKGKQEGKSFHEMIKIDGSIGKLNSDILHYHYNSIEQFVIRLNRYTTNDADYILSKGETVVWSDVLKYPADEFLKRFFLWQGYKDGLHGLVVSLLQALSRLVVFAKIWERQGFWEYGKDDLLDEVLKETNNLKKDWRHYQIQATKNPINKLALKVKRKINL